MVACCPLARGPEHAQSDKEELTRVVHASTGPPTAPPSKETQMEGFDPSSGFVGLILGSILGLVLSVLAEDYLKKRRERLQRRIVRAIRARTLSPYRDVQTFRIGPLESPYLIYEGDGENVIAEQAVRCTVDDSFVDGIPSEVLEWRKEFADLQEERRRRGEHYFWNGPNYALVSVIPDRIGIDESPGISLRFRHSDYYTFQATQRLDTPLADGSTLRSRYLSGDPFEAPDFMRSSFGLNIAMVSADDYLIVTRRSDLVGSSPGLINSSANEGLSRSLDSNGRTPPSLYNVARRGVSEELAIGADSYRLEMLAVTLDTQKHQWGAMFFAKAHDLTARDIQEQVSRGIPDRWEHKEILFIPHSIPDVLDFLLAEERRDQFSSVTPALFYFSLVRVFGRTRVEREIAKALRRLR
jgi:hypothetical protein